MLRALDKACLLAVAVVLVAIGLAGGRANADIGELSNRFDLLSSSAAGATATHLIGFTINNTGPALGSIEIQYCSNDPLPGEPCTPPDGLDVSGAILANQTGNVGFSVSPLTTANDLILTHNPPMEFTDNSPNTYELQNIVNPSSAGTYYIRLYIYPTTDATGPETEAGGIAFAINSGVSINAEVPPYLEFCVAVAIYNHDCSTATSYLIDMGDLSSHQTSAVTSQFLTATNAASGYSVSVTGTTLTSGNNIISALSQPEPSLIGASQFGLNLRANSQPSIGSDPAGPGVGTVAANYDTPNRFSFNNNDVVVSSTGTSDYRTYTASYVTNVSAGQPAGVYATTLTYICLANF